jgi:ATP-independent RNA helicase DbpA
VRFANGSCTVLVASDVAARGLDIADLAMVVNFDIASDPDVHTHRIGRTGRAGRRGIAVSLCSSRDAGRIKSIESSAYLRAAPMQWRTLPHRARANDPFVAPFVTLAVDAGRRDKLRPGDLLGALTGEAGLPAAAIGKIDVFPTRTYVAVKRGMHDQALRRLRAGKIKGRAFRVRKI